MIVHHVIRQRPGAIHQKAQENYRSHGKALYCVSPKNHHQRRVGTLCCFPQAPSFAEQRKGEKFIRCRPDQHR